MMRLIGTDDLLKVPNVRKVTEYDETGEGITYLAVPVEAIEKAPTIEAEPVRHGKWLLEVHEEGVNCRWNVTASCSECCDKCEEIWAGFFPGIPAWLAKDIALQDAKEVKLSNFCPNCGAKMDLEG
jgi:hypothetical protein